MIWIGHVNSPCIANPHWWGCARALLSIHCSRERWVPRSCYWCWRWCSQNREGFALSMTAKMLIESRQHGWSPTVIAEPVKPPWKYEFQHGSCKNASWCSGLLAHTKTRFYFIRAMTNSKWKLLTSSTDCDSWKFNNAIMLPGTIGRSQKSDLPTMPVARDSATAYAERGVSSVVDEEPWRCGWMIKCLFHVWSGLFIVFGKILGQNGCLPDLDNCLLLNLQSLPYPRHPWLTCRHLDEGCTDSSIWFLSRFHNFLSHMKSCVFMLHNTSQQLHLKVPSL